MGVVLKGTALCGGVAAAPIFFYQRPEVQLCLPASDAEAELARLERARQSAIAQLEQAYQQTLTTLGQETAQLFRGHRMMLEDADFQEILHAAIMDEGASAEQAIQRASRHFSSLLRALDDPYLQARSADVADLSARMMDLLSERTATPTLPNQPVILAAQELLPSEILGIDRQHVLALVLAHGSPLSHASILARSLGIPVLLGLGDALTAHCHGKHAVVDADSGTLYLEPSPDQYQKMQQRIQAHREQARAMEYYRGRETRSAGGRCIRLFANLSGPEDLNAVFSGDAEGIGLLRSECLFFSCSAPPKEQRQCAIYTRILQHMGQRPVTVRLWDIGGDKPVRFLTQRTEENPALGLRGIRLALAHEWLLRTQLRALLRASVQGVLSILIPMVTDLWEVKQVKTLLEQEREALVSAGVPVAPHIPLGIMVETPAAALMSFELAQEVDFFCLGTNDLVQYTLACDRQNAALQRLCQPHHPAVMDLIEKTVASAKQLGIPCHICGDMAGELALTDWFLSLGVDGLSLPPHNILPMRMHIAQLS